jgi:flagellar hook-associated protein 1 FlgK
MSLSQALNTARSIFNNTGTQSSTVSNNIANASNANYTRRLASLATSFSGASVVQILRAQEGRLQSQYLSTTSQDAAQQRLLRGLEDIKATMGGNDYETSPSTYLSALQKALQSYASSPTSTTAAQSAIAAAQDVVTALNNAMHSLQGIRAAADQEIGSNVATLNDLLSQFKTANDAVKSADPGRRQQADAMDTRDGLLKQISGIVGTTAVTRAGNDMAIYTSDGTPIFDTVARTVFFRPTNGCSAGSTGNKVYIDGAPLAAGSGARTTGQGTLQALLQIRDTIAPTYQSQLDEIGRSLVTMFSENYVNSGNIADPLNNTKAPGLFVWTRSDGIAGGTPTSGTVINGIAGTIAINSAFVTSRGGNPGRLRDGGANGANFSVNTTGASGNSGQLDAYATAMDADVSFDPTTGVDTTSSILEYAANSVGWVENYRSGASAAADTTAAAQSRSSQAYSDGTGVNLDEELSLLMDIEQSYKAGTKILNAVDEMLQSLLQIVN